MSRHLWVIEEQKRGKPWRPRCGLGTADASTNKREAERELREWRNYVPETQYRLTKYVPEVKK